MPSRNIVTFCEELAGVRPSSGAATSSAWSALGLFTNLPPAARCCSRGRLHSVSVAAPLRCALALEFVLNRNRRFDGRVGNVTDQFKILKLEIVDVLHRRVQFHLRQRARFARQLQFRLIGSFTMSKILSAA